MIIGIGTDIIRTSRITRLYRETGERLLARLLSAAELTMAAEKTPEALTPWLARQFAGKEAIAKALGTGIGEHALFTEISITRNGAGKPVAQLHGRALTRLHSLTPAGMQPAIHITLSDEGDSALAFAIIEARDADTPPSSPEFMQ